jgi:hypothetical protein
MRKSRPTYSIGACRGGFIDPLRSQVDVTQLRLRRKGDIAAAAAAQPFVIRNPAGHTTTTACWMKHEFPSLGAGLAHSILLKSGRHFDFSG